ncbi:unnamed protein product [Hymenolepis diminuta]|uniref:Reverse transcriptase n=1 Tax=Hymenolepis diminuta TaxID=6216 RepID=A0A564YRN0_HYMDI|nr:unnamed protein product [Hymenolepis diminuta]
MSITEKPKSAADLFRRKQKPGESYVQYAIAIQSILGGCTGNRFPPSEQEYLVSLRFLSGVYPPALQNHLANMEHAGIVELVKAANAFSSIPCSQSQTPTRPKYLAQPQGSPSRHPKPTRALQGKYETVRMYTLSLGNCPVVKVAIGEQTHKFLVDTGAAISIIKPETVPDRLKKHMDQKHPIVMEAVNGSTFKSEGSINLHFRLGNQRFRQRMYICSVISGAGLLGMDFLEKQQTRILLDKHKLVLNGTTELTLGHERPSLGSRLVNTQGAKPQKSGSREKTLLTEVGDIPEEVKAFLRNNEDIFALDGEPTGRSIQYQEFVSEEIANLLKNKIIRPSSSAWAVPIVVTKQKNGALRLCVDYRKLNAVTKRDQYSMPRIDDGFDYMTGSHYFSTLDLRSGYWQVEVDPKSRAKTAFVVPTGLYEFETMPFGLMNAPASFQRLMHQVLLDLIPTQCQVYLDDVIIFSRSVTEHIARLEALFNRLRQAGLRLNPKKCKFMQTTVAYLGHIISKDGVHTDPEKTAKIHKWPTLRNAEEVRLFLGLAGYYRRLTSAPILAFPDLSDDKGIFILDTDASNIATGALLSQIQNGEEHPIAHYLLGPREFILRTDHKALTWLCSFKDPEGLIGRWQEILAEYHYKLEHRPGTKHGNADAMSRIPQDSPGVATIRLSDDTLAEWANAQSKDPYISLIYDRLVHGTDKPSGKEMEGCSLDTRTLLVPMVQFSNKGRGTILSIQTKSARQISTAADFSSPDSRTVTLKLRTPRGAQNRTGCPPTILVTQYERGRGRRLRRVSCVSKLSLRTTSHAHLFNQCGGDSPTKSSA